MTTVEAGKHPIKRRRTQEERSATTREKVIKAAIECIVEEGLHNTTAARIAARSGVTWGAIAHQFGDKDSVLFAVIERNAEAYRNLLDIALKNAGPTLQDRVSALIDVTWKYINEPTAFAFNELIIHNRASSNTQILAQQEDLANRQMKIVWDKFFSGFNIPPKTLDIARNLALGTLLGLSIQLLVTNRRGSFKHEVAILKNMIVQLLESGIDGSSPAPAT